VVVVVVVVVGAAVVTCDLSLCVMCIKIPINFRQVQYLFIKHLIAATCFDTYYAILRLYKIL
jgi:hypothetical protein